MVDPGARTEKDLAISHDGAAGLHRERRFERRLVAQPELEERLADGDPAQLSVGGGGLRFVRVEGSERHQDLTDSHRPKLASHVILRTNVPARVDPFVAGVVPFAHVPRNRGFVRDLRSPHLGAGTRSPVVPAFGYDGSVGAELAVVVTVAAIFLVPAALGRQDSDTSFWPRGELGNALDGALLLALLVMAATVGYFLLGTY